MKISIKTNDSSKIKPKKKEKQISKQITTKVK